MLCKTWLLTLIGQKSPCDILVSRYGSYPSFFISLLTLESISLTMHYHLELFEHSFWNGADSNNNIKLSVVFMVGLDGLITFLTPNSPVIHSRVPPAQLKHVM